jgi:hypothetical protein
MDRARHMNAAHAINKPDPVERLMPSGCCETALRAVFMACDLFIITCHMLAPIKRRILPKTANNEETKNVKLFFNIPLPKLRVRLKCVSGRTETQTSGPSKQHRLSQEGTSNKKFWITARDILSHEMLDSV